MSDEQRIGKYIVEAELGEGSFAWVYKGYDEELDRHVAIKVLKPMWLSDPQAVNRFKQEARTMAKLHHPSIAVVYEVGEDQGQVYLSQFLVNGDTLSAKLEKEGPMSWSEMMEMLKPIASALDFAHEHGIVHRDIKPANVLVDDKNRAYLGDFGLVRAAEGSASISASTGGMVGTPAYMAPEQWEGHEVSPATDVYALSCVVVEMLTGKMLFDGATPATVMKQHLMEGPRFPAKWPDTVPDNVADVLKRGLTEEMSERIQSAGALVEALENVEADQATTALMLPWLVDVDGNRHKLKPGRNTVGRAADSDVKADTDMISPLHAALFFNGETVAVIDEGSANGTFVNDAPVGADDAILKPGDTLRVGDVVFALNTADVSATPVPPAVEAVTEPEEDSSVVEEAATVAAAAVAAGGIAEATQEAVDTPAPEPEPEPEPSAPEVESEPESPAPVVEPEPELAPPPTPEPVAAVAPPEKKSSGKGMMIVGIAVVLLIVAGVAGFFLMSGGSSTPPPATEAASSSGSGAASVGEEKEDSPTDTPEPEPTDTPEPEPTDTLKSQAPKEEEPAVEDVDADELVQQGHDFFDNGDPDQAMEAYSAAIEADPANHDAYAGRGWVHLNLGNNAEAISDYDQAIEIDPENGYNYVDRGDAYLNLGETETALADFERAVNLLPEDTYINWRKAVALDELGDPEGALAAYTTAVAVAEENGEELEPEVEARIAELEEELGSAVAEADTEAAEEEPTETPEPEPTDTPEPAAPADTPTPEPTPTEASVALSGHIAIPLLAGNSPQVIIADTDGNQVNVLASARQPAHTENGAKLVVNGDGGGQLLLRQANSDGSGAAQFGDSGLNAHSHPAWSPDGTQVIFDDRPAGKDYFAYVRGLDSSTGFGQEVAAGGVGPTFNSNPLYPLWANKGYIIRACNTWEGQANKCGIWLIEGQGGAATQLTTNGNHIPTDVSGNTVVYSSDEGGDWNVYAVDIGTGNSTKLTNSSSADAMGTVSPDGKNVAFLSNQGGGLAVWVVSTNGGEAEKLFDIDSSWGSLRGDGWADERLSWGK